jgi:hypothetical protein
MPLYFFDLHNDVDVRDPEGVELSDDRAAIANAVKEAREMICAGIKRNGRVNLSHHIAVRDTTGRVFHELPFGDAVKVERGEEVLSEPSISA